MTKYHVEFPANAPGGYGGRHNFRTRAEADAFLARAMRRIGNPAGTAPPAIIKARPALLKEAP